MHLNTHYVVKAEGHGWIHASIHQRQAFIAYNRAVLHARFNGFNLYGRSVSLYANGRPQHQQNVQPHNPLAEDLSPGELMGVEGAALYDSPLDNVHHVR